ncbi:DNA repair protein RecN [Natroniella sulfidigena]|uniref:DNA repair protein RecN n=1 Tax=Natroniella sulfidigena TaxID=723921 RepID=UPI00200ACB5A|nr:DNA repair protein RecN [Natroniella sulfidigena]MCK8817529.1 DNA repair protein RecN [Natroniella sulfidigena]
MLSNLAIQNFALIKEVELDFSSGLNILTGETGSGKSIIIKALDMLLGGRASTDYIRKGKEKAVIEAVFQITDNQAVQEELKKLGLEMPKSGEVILTREISHSGNNKSRINGRIVTLEMTRSISKHLIDIHGQHEHQSLLNVEHHLRLLDQFGGAEVLSLKEKLAEIYSLLQQKNEKLAKMNQSEKERDRRIDLLEFEVNEIETAELEIGEDEELMSEKNKLSNAEELNQVIGAAYHQLYESDMYDSAMIDQISQLAKEIDSLTKIDQNLTPIAELLTEINYQLEDVSFRLKDYQDQIEFEPQRLDIIEERLEQINDLKRKYGPTIEEILEYKEEIVVELEELKNSEVRKERLEEEIEQLRADYRKVAEQLSASRKKIAQFLEKNILQQLEDLSMPQAKFKIDFKEQQNFTKQGIDKVEFLIAPNPGADFKPLAKIASGGELSRTMLALKTITADIDQISSLVFDEVDTGIGGRVAKLVANKLLFLAKKHQVICITHLPQIAAMADQHYLIMKKLQQEGSQTVVHSLTTNGRIRELARMLDGSLNTKTLEHAKELIKAASEKKEAI